MSQTWGILVVWFALMMSSCATGVSYEAIEPGLGPIADGDGRVVVYRLRNEGKRASPTVRAGGEPIGRAVPGSFFVADLPAGMHSIAGARNTDYTLDLNVAAGNTHYVRVEFELRQMRFDWGFVEVPEETALAQLATTTNTGK